ncbi:MAG: hypothetical protein F4213_19255 [Boseongicola sp. SB0677_bin_26]|nr:hypothetical protein [Boseongicola sp. SB0677_bin_26]
MTIRIPDTVLDGLAKWMMRGPWPEHFQEAINDHMHAYCDAHDLDTFEEMAARIGPHWVTVLNEMARNDFLGRETEDGNVVDLHLKRRGWNEKAIPKACLKGIRESVTSLYEVSDIRPGESFVARDLILEDDPILVEERSATVMTRRLKARGFTSDLVEAILDSSAKADLAALESMQMFEPGRALRESVNCGASS